jgi:hypothetical protein
VREDLIRSLNYKAANPSKKNPLHADLLLKILDERGPTDGKLASAALGNAGRTEGVRRGADGVAYAVVQYGDWNDFAYFALTETEAAERGIPALGEQSARVKELKDKRAAAAADQVRFERELDV